LKTYRSSATEQTKYLGQTPVVGGALALTLPVRSVVTLYARASDIGPTQPQNISPTDGMTNSNVTPTLESSEYISTKELPSCVHRAGQWTLFSNGIEVWTSGTDSTHRTSLTVPKLAYGTEYEWRVRYCDNDDTWSAWSDGTRFTTRPDTPPKIAADALYYPARGAVLDASVATYVIWYPTRITDMEDGDSLAIERISVHREGTLEELDVVASNVPNSGGYAAWAPPVALAEEGGCVLKFAVRDSGGMTAEQVFGDDAFVVVPEPCGGVSAVFALLWSASMLRRRRI
jgi:hypothetical protein